MSNCCLNIHHKLLFLNIYSYPTRPGHQILKNLNLTLPPSKTVAIVGESGGGNYMFFMFMFDVTISMHVKDHVIISPLII